MKIQLRDYWRQLPGRDRQLLGMLGVFLLAVLAFYGFWQPASQRWDTAQALYSRAVLQAAQVQLARPTLAAKGGEQPLATRLSESAASAGLNVQQFEMDARVLRITLSGDAVAVLGWLERIEQEDARFESVRLEKRDLSLQAQLQLSNNPL